MYIWTGCLLPAEFQQELRSVCLAHNRDVGLDTTAFDMPQHISLKISLPIADEKAEAVFSFLESFLSREEPFYVNLLSPEVFRNILWLPVEENPTLRRLHDTLDKELLERFSVSPHSLDQCFFFHSTLFMDPDTDKLTRMEKLLSDLHLGKSLPVERFLLGYSPDGQPGTYAIRKEIKLL